MIVGDRTEEMRDTLRKRAQSSTYVMAGVIGFHDITAELHLQMCRWIDRPSIRKLGLVPRDHLKTSVWTIANSIKRIAENPNIRILLGNETATNSQHFLRRIEAVFERCDLFRWLFPEIIPDFTKTKWSETEMLVARDIDYPESTVEAIGVGGAVVSRHYNLIKLDDLVGKEASESPEIMKKTIDWYQYCESLLEKPQDEINTCGTRWAFNDLYAWIEKNEGDDIDRFFRSCYKENGEPIWPERFDEQALRRIRRKMGSFKFSCQYLNNPSDPESASFRPEWLRFYNWAGDDGIDRMLLPESGSPFRMSELTRFMRVDPAISESPGAARSAIIVDGVKNDGRKFILEAWARKCHPFEMIEKVFDFQDEYDCVAIGVEAVVYQRILKPVIEKEAERRGKWLNIVELKPDTREKKHNRIRGVQPELERGNIWLRKDQEDFLEEYHQFPVGSTVDLLDAWAYGPHMWFEPLDDEEDVKEERVFQRHSGRSEVTGY